jgi:hypothetical protein
MNRMDELAISESAKRDRCLSDQQRWAMLQSAIDWADRQQPFSRNSPKACRLNEERINARRDCIA